MGRSYARYVLATGAGAGLLGAFTFGLLVRDDAGAASRVASVATAGLVAGAALAIGALAGFLFSLPRYRQEDRRDDTSANREAGIGTRSTLIASPLEGNNNLLQVSDWLTKILVGVGLTKLQEIPDGIVRLSRATGNAFAPTERAAVGSGATLVYFAVLGFIVGYLETRLYLAALLRDVERGILESTALVDLARAPVRRTGAELSIDLDDRLQAYAVTLAAQPSDALRGATELRAWAKAKIHSGDPQAALHALRRALATASADLELRADYVLVVSALGSPDEARTAMEQADSAVSDQGPVVQTYESLIFNALYMRAPDGFARALEFADKYLRRGGEMSGKMWTYVAAAHGQKCSYLKSHGASEVELEEQRRLALDAAKHALTADPHFARPVLRQLWDKTRPKPAGETDLEVFYDESLDNPFRLLLIGKA